MFCAVYKVCILAGMCVCVRLPYSAHGIIHCSVRYIAYMMHEATLILGFVGYCEGFIFLLRLYEVVAGS